MVEPGQRKLMRAVVWPRYGPPEVLELRQLPRPAPESDEILIKVHATTVTAGDCEMRSLSFPIYLALPLRLWIGVLRPRGTTIPGTEFAGVVEEVGSAVTQFNVGDRVFGSTGMAFGANAEYLRVPAAGGDMNEGAAIMPANMTFDQVAGVPFGARDALHFLRQAQLASGVRLLINGAGGSIGTYAVQLAKRQGAEVTVVDSGPKLKMLADLGADHGIDYTQHDFRQHRQAYDVIFDVVGTLPIGRMRAMLEPGGIILLANPRPHQLLGALANRLRGGPAIFLQPASGTTADLEQIRRLIEAGELRSVVDRAYLLEEIVEAHRYVETGAKQGNLVISVSEE